MENLLLIPRADWCRLCEQVLGGSMVEPVWAELGMNEVCTRSSSNSQISSCMEIFVSM